MLISAMWITLDSLETHNATLKPFDQVSFFCPSFSLANLSLVDRIGQDWKHSIRLVSQLTRHLLFRYFLHLYRSRNQKLVKTRTLHGFEDNNRNANLRHMEDVGQDEIARDNCKAI